MLRLTRAQSVIAGLTLIFLFFIGSFILLDRDAGMRQVEDESRGAIDEELEKSATFSFSLDRFYRSETRDGRKIWEVWSDRGEYSPQDKVARLSQARLLFHQENGDSVELRADSALLHLDEGSLKEARVYDNVTLLYNGGLVIETQDAYYHQESNSIEAPGDVSIRGEDFHITGRKLSAALDREEFNLSKNVKSMLKSRGSGGIKHAAVE